MQGRIDGLLFQLEALVESLALAQAVRAAANTEPQNIDEAFAMRSALDVAFSALEAKASEQAAPSTQPAGSALAGQWYDALRAAHAGALADLQARSADLARLTSYTPQTWQPVWFISYQLYGTVRYADEIMAMNPHIRHPLLVQPGRALRVVKHG